MSTEQGPQDEGPKPEAPAMEWDKLAKTALDEIGQGYRIWASDGGSLTPWRLEFYLRDAGVALPAAVGFISLDSLAQRSRWFA